MFFDLMYFIGGNALVEIADAIIAPVYSWVCDVAMTYDVFSPLATFLESILS